MIDVVIPVYRGAAATRACLDSVLSSRAATPCEIVVVDDATPEPEIAALLDAHAAEGRVTLLRNPRNLGFVQSVNRGMALHPDRDVVLLNSDTVVANDWLGRMHAHLHSAEDVATVTPFSNNATICSYPFEGWNGGVPGRLGLQQLDGLFARVNAGRSLPLPTAVGFWMMVRREALAQLGLFDAERFGRGYGEENDFCMRALKAGWRHLLAGDVYVEHVGSVSFSHERQQRVEAATRALLEVHPEYTGLVREFLERDPAAPLREAVDLARTALGSEEAAHVLRERAEERSRLLSGLWNIEKAAQERDSAITQLNHALSHATAHVAERDDQIRAKDEEIQRLRDGLQVAEGLAFSRERELQHLRDKWWRRALKAVATFLRLRPPAVPH